jgi:hypothetical protein
MINNKMLKTKDREIHPLIKNPLISIQIDQTNNYLADQITKLKMVFRKINIIEDPSIIILIEVKVHMEKCKN